MKSAQLFVGSRLAAGGRKSKAGAALIITLACIVILTALVLAFLSHSLLETRVALASADQTSASLLARGGIDAVIGELKQEITAGSVTTYPPGGSDVRDPNCIFLPAANQAMLPYRMDPAAPANVIKRSAYNVPFYSGSYYNTAGWPAPEWAANFSTTNPGTAGRSISMSRWNQALLMPPAWTTNTPSTDITPVGSFDPPDWIYVTRAGAASTVWTNALIPNMSGGTINTNCVMGRYSYVVYDEGGLLDANAAGYSTASGVTPSMMRNKISEACADLTQIGLTSSDIDSLVKWRNPINGTNATMYTNYVYSPNTNAFLTPAVTPSGSERMFTSRQQMIGFLTQNVAASQTDVERMQAALPYLTEFSRELNAPSWYPQTNGPISGYAYKTLATTSPSAATNVFAPLARAGSAYTDQTTGLTAQANQAVAFGRFPLSRLSWITLTGLPPAGVTAAQIKQSFGLVWDSSNTAWLYTGPSSASVQSAITPLSQITGREPNFFEVLKAGILSGSVGIEPSPYSGLFPAPGDIDSRYGVYDQQIMQIGLAMIDQASGNALPTRVEFGANAGKAANGDDMALYGSKSLPYLYKMIYSPFRPTTEPSDAYGNQVMFDAWIEPVFWNPYQTVTPNASALNLRIRADGTNAASGTFGATTIPNATTAPVQTCTPEVACGGPGTGAYLELDSASTATFDNTAANPIMLNSLLTSGALSSAPDPSSTDSRANSPWVGGPANADIYTEGSTTYAGFWLGHIFASNYPLDPKAASPYGAYSTATFYNGTTHNRTDHSFVLEADYGGGKYLEVQRMTFKYFTGQGYVAEGLDNFTVPARRLEFYTISDPRTGRFSFDLVHPASYSGHEQTSELTVTAADEAALTLTGFANSANYFAGLSKDPVVTSTTTTILPATAANSNGPALDDYRYADNTSTAYGTSTPAYSDTDGVQRAADGWWNNAGSGVTANTLPMREDTPQDRPVMLNRPFYSVGELGYVYRDMPWRSLDFCTTNSADAGLLDYFCVNDGYAGSTNAPVAGGRFNLNTPYPQVLQAMLNGAARAQLFPAYDISAGDATNMANAITNITWNATAPLPLLNKSELATRLAPADPTVLPTATAEPGIDTNIKERREALVRALASAGQVRTWNLMIDVVAQTGHFPPTATGFQNFLVTAEQRYWAHVAIDRYTGQVIGMQIEPVSQ